MDVHKVLSELKNNPNKTFSNGWTEVKGNGYNSILVKDMFGKTVDFVLNDHYTEMNMEDFHNRGEE